MLPIPAGFWDLKMMVDLFIFEGQIEEIPAGIGNMERLQRLDLRKCPIRKLAPEIGKCRRLQSLLLDNCRLAELPAEIGNLTGLTSLDLWENELAALPPEIGKLKSLTRLKVAGNRIKELPEEIGNLVRLEELTVGGNRLTRLPDSIRNLSRLSVLSLSGNPLKEFPDAVRGMKNLTQLMLGDIVLRELPVDLKKFEKLEHFYAKVGQGQNARLFQLSSAAECAAFRQPIPDIPGRVELKVEAGLVTAIPSESEPPAAGLRFQLAIDGEASPVQWNTPVALPRGKHRVRLAGILPGSPSFYRVFAEQDVQVGEAVTDPVETLVEQLGAGEAADREVARRKLLALGKTAIPALEKAKGNPDPEVSAAARSILEALKGKE
jgi:hypothetical protein